MKLSKGVQPGRATFAVPWRWSFTWSDFYVRWSTTLFVAENDAAHCQSLLDSRYVLGKEGCRCKKVGAPKTRKLANEVD